MEQRVEDEFAAGRERGSEVDDGVHEEAAQAGVREPLPTVDVNRTELGNARRLIAQSGQDLRWVPELKAYIIWRPEEGRWRVDDDGAANRMVHDLITALWEEATAAWNAVGEMEDGPPRDEAIRHARALTAHANRSEQHNAIENCLKIARSLPGVMVRLEQLDADKMLFNCLNGTVDLRTGERRDARREDLITKLAGGRYLPGQAQCPRFLRVLDRALGGNRELLAYLWRAFGKCCSGKPAPKAFFVFQGPGDTAKTTVIEIVGRVFKDYGRATRPELLIANRSAGNIPNDLAQLCGARFVWTSETERGAKLAVSKVKALAGGGDTLTARFLHKEFFDFIPECVLFLSTNHPLGCDDSSDPVWDRMNTVPFNVVIPKDEQDRELVAKLLAEEADGIVTWLVEGCLEYERTGLGHCAVVQERRQELREEADLLNQFLDERCVVVPAYLPADADLKADPARFASRLDTKGGELYVAYADWAKQRGVPQVEIMNSKRFGAELRDRGFLKYKFAGSWWKGVALRPATRKDDRGREERWLGELDPGFYGWWLSQVDLAHVPDNGPEHPDFAKDVSQAEGWPEVHFDG